MVWLYKVSLCLSFFLFQRKRKGQLVSPPFKACLLTLFWRELNLPYVQMRTPRRGADAWICSWDAPHNKPGTAQYLAPMVSHAHQSARAPPTCQRVLFLLNTLSCPAEFGAPLIRSYGALHPRGPWLYVYVYLLGEDFIKDLLGRGHPCLPGWWSFTCSLEAADEMHDQGKQILDSEDAEELFSEFVVVQTVEEIYTFYCSKPTYNFSNYQYLICCFTTNSYRNKTDLYLCQKLLYLVLPVALLILLS